MYALALSYSAAIALPFFHLGQLDVGIPIQAFGVIVAIGVLIGAGLLRRYAEWHGVSDDHIRGLTGWVTITGFIGAHVFDVLAYQWDDFIEDPTLIVMIWKGISSYGGFLGGTAGWFFYVWWKRLPMRMMADTTVIGLLVAFSIGRIGCTVVSDHIGAAVDPTKWYAFMAMDYPRAMLIKHYPNLTGETIKAWNLGLIEFLYLVPVNALILWLAFGRRAEQVGVDEKTKAPIYRTKINAGTLIVLAGVLYTPVRFFLEFLRPNDTDPRYVGLTFAQWCSMLTFGACVAVAFRIFKGGKPSDKITDTSGEAQRRLKMILKEDPREQEEKSATKDSKKSEPAPKKNAALAKTLPEDDDDDELAKEALAAKADKADDADKK